MSPREKKQLGQVAKLGQQGGNFATLGTPAGFFRLSIIEGTLFMDFFGQSLFPNLSSCEKLGGSSIYAGQSSPSKGDDFPADVTYPRTVLRGLDSQRAVVGVHWVRVSADKGQLLPFRHFLGLYFGECEDLERGHWNYDRSFEFSDGVTLNYDSDSDRCERIHSNRITIDVPGCALDRLSGSDLETFLVALRSMDVKCTRLDIFYDDFSRRILPCEVHAVAKLGDYVRFRTVEHRESYKGTQRTMDMVNFGRRGSNGSGSFLRCYDKRLESKGENVAVRWELELTGKKSHLAFMGLTGFDGNLEGFAACLGSLVGGSIDFLKRTGDKNLNRLERYSWWEDIKSFLGAIRLRPKKAEYSVEKVKKWVSTAVAPSLACLRDSFGTDENFLKWLSLTLQDGSNRMRSKHRKMLRELEDSQLIAKKKRTSFYGDAVFVV